MPFLEEDGPVASGAEPAFEMRTSVAEVLAPSAPEPPAAPPAPGAWLPERRASVPTSTLTPEAKLAPSSVRTGLFAILWLAAGIVVGFGLSFVLGGPARIWIAAGAAAGLAAGLGWIRWMQRR